MITKITYTDKEALQNDPEVPDKNKVSDTDMNMIKQVVNNNADELDTAKENIEDLDGRKANESDVLDVLYELLRTEERLNANISTRALITEAGNKIVLEINNQTYVLTAKLYDKNNNLIHTSNSIDLPLETMVVNATYNKTTKKIILTLQNGNTVEFSIADLIDGLVNQSDFDALEEKVEENETDIETLQTENTELKAENERLRNDLNNSTLTVEGTGENVTLENTTDARFKKFIVEGNSEQETRSGKNLAEISLAEGTFQGISYTKSENGGVRANGTTAEDKGSYRRILTKKFKAGTYTFSVKGFEVENATSRLEVIRGDSSIKQLSKNLSSLTVELNDEEEIHINIVVVKNITIDETIYLQIEEGTEATEYEEYGAMPSIEFPSEIKTVKDNANIVVCNKNLWNSEKYSLRKNTGISTSNINKNDIMLKGIPSWSNYTLVFENKYKNMDYCINVDFFSSLARKVGITVYSNNTLDAETSNLNKISSTNLDLTANTKTNSKILFNSGDYNYLVFRFWNNNSGTALSSATELYINNIQLEQNTEATDYIANEQQEFIVPVQQEMFTDDYFDFENEKEVHGWNKVVFNGTENWEYTNNVFRILKSDVITTDNTKAINIKSNYYINYPQSTIQSAEVDYGISARTGNGSTNGIAIRNKDYTDVNNFKEYLAQQYTNGTPVYAWYKLATPEKLAFTEQQITVAKQIKDTVHSYGEKTHIYSTDEVSPIFDVEACGDINKYDLNEIDNIKQAIVALGGVI